MKHVIIASQNPTKMKSAQDAFHQVFPQERFIFEGVKISSGVSAQPLSEKETIEGARNRVRRARTQYPKADFWVAFEGGSEKVDAGEMRSFAWAFVLSRDLDIEGRARTLTWYLPPRIVRHLEQGKELGDAIDIEFHRKNSRQQEGAIGIISEGLIDRVALYTPAMVVAILPFKQTKLYQLQKEEVLL